MSATTTTDATDRADAYLAEVRRHLVTLADDEGRRPGTTVESISGIRPALPGGSIAAGNASQFSDGAGAVLASTAIVRESSG